MSEWYLYIIEKNGKLYVGITTNLENRLRQHGSPKILVKEGPFEKETAARREKQIKAWSRKKKLELVSKSSSQLK
jgi:putative endonuclease